MQRCKDFRIWRLRYLLGIMGILRFFDFVIFFLIIAIRRYFNLVFCVFNINEKIFSHLFILISFIFMFLN